MENKKMVEFRSILFVFSFVLSFFFFFIFFFFPRSFSASYSFFCLLSFFFFFLPLSWCLAFLNSLSKFLYSSVHMVGDQFLSSPMKSTPTSACSTSTQTHVLALVLDPCLDSLLGALTSTSTSTSWSSSPLLRSVVRWQDVGAGAIMWVSRQIRIPSPSSLSHLTLSLSGLSLLYFFRIFDKFEKG